MKKIIFSKTSMFCVIVAISMLFSNQIQAQPKIEIVKSTIDFGVVNYKNTPIKHQIIVKSIGTEKLKINEVQPGCGCTIANITSKEIAPGDSAIIEMSLDITKISGKSNKNITVTSNDPNNPKSTILMNFVVERPFEVLPKYLSFDKVIVGEPTMSKVEIKNNSTSDAVIKSVSIDNNSVICNLQANDVIKKGEKFPFSATVIASQKGSVKTRITIEIFHPDEKSIVIDGYGNAVERIVEGSSNK